ncbi:MAG: four helix bundle suffix domain-containing protein [Bacteroidales bacterium]|nr:four helix bundle suffix domain-containing protein [Candidatus Sodaliphilus aphodohippi]
MEKYNDKKTGKVLKVQAQWKDLYFYQKSDVIYQMAFVFCDRFIHLYKDRTRDQVIQAARSCKQNIVEGLSDGVTSAEMQLKLLNVARSSLQELREDFEDYIKSRNLKFFGNPTDMAPQHYFDHDTARYDAMLAYCRTHNKLEAYEPFFRQWTDEELCNYGLTICHMTDKMMMSFMQKLEHEFVTEGGIKERMYRARTGYRQQQDERLKQLEQQLQEALQETAKWKAEAQKWQAANENLKQRALKAYYEQQDEIKRLKEELSKKI